MRAAGLVVVLVCAGCNKSLLIDAPDSSPSKELSDPPAAGAPLQRAGPEKTLEQSTLLPCEAGDEECWLRGKVDEALEAGELSHARALLDEHLKPPVSQELQVTELIVRGRVKLESEPLAYGSGGKKSEEALADFELALKINAKRNDARLQRARALLSLGRGETALADLRSLAAEELQDAEVQASFGIALLAVGNVQAALAPLRRAADLDPTEAERFVVLGSAQMLEGQLDAAEGSFRAAIHLDGSSASAQGNLGAVLLVAGRIGEGREHLRRASLMAPRKATYLSNLSYAELLDGDLISAATYARRAIALDAKLASAWLNLGLVQVAQKNHAEARKSFLEAQKLDPTDPRPGNNLSDLDELER